MYVLHSLRSQAGNSRIQLLMSCIGAERGTFVSVLCDCYKVGSGFICVLLFSELVKCNMNKEMAHS